MSTPPRQTSWKFFTTSEEAWEGMLDSCRRAKKTIDLEQYVLGKEGAVEDAFRDVLLAKKKEGVRIRLLLDAVGSWHFYGSDRSREYLDAGVEIVFHYGILRPELNRLLPLLLRDHRKLLIVDEEEVHIGGVIIQERARSWRDTAILLRGPEVKDCLGTFESVWRKAKHLDPVGHVASTDQNVPFFIAGNSYHLRQKALYRSFLKAITGAKNYVYITTPYFSPNWEFRRALYFAKRKGVDVRVLLPKRSDNILSDWIALYYIPKLLRRGIKIYYYTPVILHAKTMVIDDNWATVGSCNFDWLSFWINYELNVISREPLFAEELRNIFLRDLETTEQAS